MNAPHPGVPRRRLLLSPLVAASFVIVVSHRAHAQTPAPPLPQDRPTEQPTEQPAPAPTTGTTGTTGTTTTTTTSTGLTQQAEASLGALLMGGNVQSAGGQLGGFYALRAGRHAVRGDVLLGLAALAIDADANPDNGFTRVDAQGTPREATLLDNVNSTAQAKARYDFFVADTTSVYAAALAQHDSAQNLLVRLRGDVGARQFVFAEARHALAVEVGAVYTIDDGLFDPTNADTNGDGRLSVWGDATSWESSGGVVAARLGLTYENTLVERLSLRETLEVLPNLSFPGELPGFGLIDAPFEAARLGGDGHLGFGEATIARSVTTLSVQAGAGLSLGVTLTLAYDAGAIARRNAMTNADGALAVQLGYRLF